MALLTALTGYAFYASLWKELPNLNIAELLSRLNLNDILIAFTVYSIDLVLAIIAWIVIIGMMSGYWRVLPHTGIYLLTNITRRLPGTFWYVVGRLVLYERVGIPRSTTVLASGMEFAATVVAGLVVALTAWPLVLSTTNIAPYWFLLPLCAGIALLSPPPVRALMRRFAPEHAANIRYRHLLTWVLLYVVVWIGGGVILFVLVNAVQPQPLSALPAIVGVWAAAGVAAILLFSFVPFGLGVTEITLATLLSPFLSTTEALFVALVLRVLATLAELFYGLIGVGITVYSVRYVNNTFGLPQEYIAHSSAEMPEIPPGVRQE
jgi:hypothetical protein